AAGAELQPEADRPDDRRVLGDVVGLDTEVVGDRGIRRRERVARVAARERDEDGACRGRAGIAAGGAIGSDHVARRRPDRCRRSLTRRRFVAEAQGQRRFAHGVGLSPPETARRPRWSGGAVASRAPARAWSVSVPAPSSSKAASPLSGLASHQSQRAWAWPTALAR